MTGIEPFIDPFAGGLVGVLVDTAKRVGGGLAQSLSDRTKATEALRRYADRYTARYGEIRLLGMKQGFPLESIYTKVRFLDELSIHNFSSIETLEKAFRDTPSRRLQDDASVTLESLPVINENQYLMVLGKPGAGKTTFVRCVGLEALRGEQSNLTHRCIPVLLELKRFDIDSVDLTQAISKELSDFGFPCSAQFTIDLLEQGKLLVLLDGLDEIPKEVQDVVIEAIQAFTTRYDQNRYIVSCRVAAYRSTLNRFRDIEIADFDDAQIQRFMENWFRCSGDADIETAAACWESLNYPGNSASKELAHNPLLLAFLCRAYDREKGFPRDRATLYRKALDSLLKDWSIEKRLQQAPIHQEFHSEVEKALLSEIAFKGFVNNQLFFIRQELVDSIKAFASDVVEKPRALNSMAVLDAIAIQQGILVERAEDIYSFSHLTLQEYLVARHISQNPAILKGIVEQHACDQRWREVFLLLSGSLGNSDELLQCIETACARYVQQGKPRALLDWADKITRDSTSGMLPAAKRAIAIAWAINLILNKDSSNETFKHFSIQRKLTIHPTLAYYLSNSTVDGVFSGAPANIEFLCDTDRINKLEKLGIFANVDFDALAANVGAALSRVPDGQKEDDALSVQSVQQYWAEAFHLEEGRLDLSTKELEALAAYLYGNLLMLNCRDSAVRASEPLWTRLKDRMVMTTDTLC